MDSVNTDEKVESFLSIMLESYEGSLVNVSQFIDQTTEQLDGAIGQREDIESKIAELKGVLGLEEDAEMPKLELVKEES